MINKRAPFDGLGAEKVIWDIGRRFADKGHKVTFFCPSPTKKEPPNVPGISFEFVETSSPITQGQIEFFLKGPLYYRDIYDKVQPDLVYDNPSPFLFHLAHFYGETPVVSKVHTIYRRQAFLAKDHPIVKVGTILGEETYRFLNGELLTPVSYSTSERLRPLVDTNKNTVTTNLNGINSSEVDFSFDSESKQVLYLSKLGQKKGITILLKAWKQVKEKVPELSLVVAGTGPLEDRARQLAKELKLQDVNFTGYVSPSYKQKLFAESFIYTLPTYIEGMPLTPLEAMASGCAVISTDTYGVKDIITDDKNGRLVEPGNPEQLATALKELSLKPELAHRLALAGKKRAEELTVNQMLDRELEIVNDWLDKQK